METKVINRFECLLHIFMSSEGENISEKIRGLIYPEHSGEQVRVLLCFPKLEG